MRSSLFFGCHAAESLLRCIDRHPTSGLTSAKVGVKQGGWQENMLHRRAKTRQMQHILHGLQRIWHVQVAIKGISPLTKLKSGHSGTDGDVGGEHGTNGGANRGQTGDKWGTNGGSGARSRVKICTKNRRPCVLSHVVMGRKAAGWLSKTMARTTRRRRRRSASCPCCGRVRRAPRGCIRPRSAGQRAARACRAAGRGR